LFVTPSSFTSCFSIALAYLSSTFWACS
jgi:hypothetical protein